MLGSLNPFPVAGQANRAAPLVSIRIKVVDNVTGDPLPGALIEFPGIGFATVADETGGAHAEEVALGEYLIRVSCLGYNPSEGMMVIEREGELTFHLSASGISSPSGDGWIRGQVVSRESGDPIPAALVRLDNDGPQALTTDNGWFEFRGLSVGAHTVSVSHLAFSEAEKPILLEAGSFLDLRIPLSIEPIPLEGILVTARPRWIERTGFFRRQENANAYSGHQWTREQIEARNPMFIQDLLTTVPGIRQVTSRRTGKAEILGRRRCRLAIYVDDHLMPGFDVEELDPKRIEAIEVYHGGSLSMPPEYGMRHCGVILIWMRK